MAWGVTYTVNFDSVRVIKLRGTQEKDFCKSPVLLLSESINNPLQTLVFKITIPKLCNLCGFSLSLKIRSLTGC